MSDSCTPKHDWFTATLTFGLCCGLIISYAPQHFRIIANGSSRGFSSLFLLLGSIASACGMLNMLTMQWRTVRCCRFWSLGSCIEMTAGIVQVGLQWLLFTITFVLYMLYYPPQLKYIATETDTRLLGHVKRPSKTDQWSTSIISAWITGTHFIVSTIITFSLLLTYPGGDSPTSALPRQVSTWATFLGLSSALLSAVQYAPQLLHTYRMKLVGALSIPMMCIQSPGSAIMVLSIALRPGTNWTSWIMFAVSGAMQASLLVMCISWKYRQRRLGVDDFGNQLSPSLPATAQPYSTDGDRNDTFRPVQTGLSEERTPLLMPSQADN